MFFMRKLERSTSRRTRRESNAGKRCLATGSGLALVRAAMTAASQIQAPQRRTPERSAARFDEAGAFVEPEIRRLRRLQIDARRQGVASRRFAERSEELRSDAETARARIGPDHAEIVVRGARLES